MCLTHKRILFSKDVLLNCIVIMQISTSVQQTTVVAAPDSRALTLWAALPVPRYVLLDTPVMESIVWVSQSNNVCKVCACLYHDFSFVGSSPGT